MANKRTVKRRCEICDRGHMCFDLKDRGPGAVENIEPLKQLGIGDCFKIREGLWGAWHGEKRYMPANTEVLVLNVMTSEVGELRAMVQCAPDGDTLWCSGGLLQKYRGKTVGQQQSLAT